MLKNVLNVKYCVLPLSVGVYFNAFKVNVISHGSYQYQIHANYKSKINKKAFI